jgi:hypothetical protein
MIYAFDEYALDTQLYELRHAGALLQLEPKVFDLLLDLIQHRDRIVSKHELLEHLWPSQFISDATFDHCVMAARRAVGDDGQRQRPGSARRAGPHSSRSVRNASTRTRRAVNSAPPVAQRSHPTHWCRPEIATPRP